LWSVGAAATLRAVMRPLAVCLGTAPDVVRLAPVVHELRRRDLPVAVVSATRDPETLFPTLATFGLDADLHVPGAAGPAALGDALERVKPAAVVVQGEAAAAVDGAHAAGARAIPVAHVASSRRPLEADAFGAEVRRREIASVARWLFLPGEVPIAGLLRAGVHPTGIAISGATTADAVRWVADRRGLLERPRTAGRSRALARARRRGRGAGRPCGDARAGRGGRRPSGRRPRSSRR